MNLVQVIDLGTTNIKSGVVNPQGEVVSQFSRELTLERPEPGAVEHDPEELFERIGDVSRKANSGLRSNITHLVLSSYIFGFLPLDEKGKPLTGLITLLDERAKSVMEKVRNEFSIEKLYRKTGCPPLFIYSLPRIIWLKEEKPEVYEKTKSFADSKSFLIHKLTGKLVTDPSTASATQLFNIFKGEWDEEVCGWLGLEKSALPVVRPGHKELTSLPRKPSSLLGLQKGISVIPGLYDGGAMILGMGGYGGDHSVCNLGTTAMLRKCSPELVLDNKDRRRLQTYKLFDNYWAIGGSLNNAGIALKWFRDNFTNDRSYDFLVDSARKVEPGSEGLLFLPFLTGERDPRIGNFSSGVFFGLKSHHSRQHLVRAIMEGVAHSLGFVLDTMGEQDIEVNRLIIGGSGSKSALWLQLIADILEVPIEKAVTEDATLVGGAMLAYQDEGTYPNLKEASESMVAKGEDFYPRDTNLQVYRKSHRFFEKLVNRMKPLFDEHQKLS